MEAFSRTCPDERRATLQEGSDGMIPRIQRRIRSVPDRALDFEDLMSSGRRRLDKALLEGKLDRLSPEQVELYFVQILRRLVADEARRERCRRAAEAEAARAAASRLDRLSAGRTLKRICACLRPDERALLEFRARGMRHRQIAEELGIPLSTHLARWRRLRDRLKRRPLSEWDPE